MITIRYGSDWITVDVNGVLVIDGHNAHPSDWSDVLERCGITVDYDDTGDFCSYCSEWTHNLKRINSWDDVCQECYEKYKEVE